MREILFRGKCKYNGKWIQGYLVELGKESFSDNERYGICNEAIPLFGSEVCYNLKIDEVIQETIGQYTGLTDKNGNKVFEGDIVKNDCGMTTSVGFYRGRYYPFIAFPESRCWDEEECEVIGNIHENPRIIKGA